MFTIHDPAKAMEAAVTIGVILLIASGLILTIVSGWGK